MTHAILWLLTIEALGLLALPFAYALLPALKDRGFGFAKPLGMLMLAYPVWLLGSAQIPLGPRATAALVFVALAVAAAVLARRLWPELVSFVRREWRLLVATEASSSRSSLFGRSCGRACLASATRSSPWTSPSSTPP